MSATLHYRRTSPSHSRGTSAFHHWFTTQVWCQRSKRGAGKHRHRKSTSGQTQHEHQAYRAGRKPREAPRLHQDLTTGKHGSVRRAVQRRARAQRRTGTPPAERARARPRSRRPGRTPTAPAAGRRPAPRPATRRSTRTAAPAGSARPGARRRSLSTGRTCSACEDMRLFMVRNVLYR